MSPATPVFIKTEMYNAVSGRGKNIHGSSKSDPQLFP